MGLLDSLQRLIIWLYTQPLVALYVLIQKILVFVFAPNAPPPSDIRKLQRPRIAIIGAGLTGVSAASHCVGHGFDVKIFEARSKEKGLGGIWSVSLKPHCFYLCSLIYG